MFEHWGKIRVLQPFILEHDTAMALRGRNEDESDTNGANVLVCGAVNLQAKAATGIPGFD